ncbi:hypothetical protein CHUAL_003128 [Chamberlinius hualienensis]
MKYNEWTIRKRNYDREKRERDLLREEVSDHPLKPFVTMVSSEGRGVFKRISSTSSSAASSAPGTPRRPTASVTSAAVSVVFDPLTSVLDGTDPLSQFAAMQDPLSKMAAEFTPQERDQFGKNVKQGISDVDETFEPWNVKKLGILSKYTTSEKLSMATSFLSGGEKVVLKTHSSVADKVKTRLEQLDDFEEGSVKEMLNLSQQEYVNRIEELNKALIEAWEVDQRVKALKIVIQCSKLLADTSVIQFYPSKFVLVTDILDTFGSLVFNRIRTKSEYLPAGSKTASHLPENFNPEMVPESAKETCRNWFYKIASIRELIPRLYVEVAILKSYSFLTMTEFSAALMRLTKMVLGIGDPLVAAYARCYLCRVGVSIAPEVRDYLYENLYDFLATYSQLTCVHVQNELLRQKVDFTAYMTLYSPALDWIIQCIAHKAHENTLTQIIDKCKQICNRFAFSSSGLLLNSIMTAFRPELIANRALMFVELMKECQDSGFPKHLLFRTLGLCLIVADPPENQRLQILNEVWKVVGRLKNISEYMKCAEVWVEYPVKHFSKREVNTFLGDIIRHVTPDRAFENHYHQLHSVVDRILTHIDDFAVLFSMDKFLPFLDMFQKESVKVDACKLIMESFAKNQNVNTSDPVIINALMFICKTLHDSVNALTLDDDKRQIGWLISCFVRRVSFGRDFEQQLSFYVEARATFANLDSVLIALVQCVNKLSMETRNVVNGHHTRKTAAFVRACAAYSFITIPSLCSVFSRLELYLLTAQVTLLNQCLGQADGCLKAAISLIPQVPNTMEIDGKLKSTDAQLTSYINSLLATLLVTPDHPEHGTLYVLRGLLNVIQEYQWDNMDYKIQLQLNALAMLSSAAQENYLYHIEKVDSNDALYGNDEKFVSEIGKLCSTLLKEALKSMADNDQKRTSENALLLFTYVVAFCDVDVQETQALAANLWSLANKSTQLDTKLKVRTIHSKETLA